jgi:hypothetical protein
MSLLSTAIDVSGMTSVSLILKQRSILIQR